MPEWHAQRLVYVNDRYDQDNASDGRSRYGAYLRQRPSEFRDGWSDEAKPVQTAEEFAVHAWRVATAPVMVPGYVWVRPDLHGITLHCDDDDASLYAEIRVPLTHHRIGGGPNRFPYAWQDWEAEPDYSGAEYRSLLEPRSAKKPAVLATATVRVPGEDWANLVTPSVYEGPELLAQAREAVFTVAQHINDDAGPIIARLLQD